MDHSFRTAQAVSDLIHHVKPLLGQHLATVAGASGMTLAETGEAFRSLRDDGYVFKRDETLPLLMGFEHIAATQATGFELAVVVLLADGLQVQNSPDALATVWPVVTSRLSSWPATLRAAVSNGLRRADELGHIKHVVLPKEQDYQTRTADVIVEQLVRIARSMRRDELYEVAQADHGTDIEKHFAALMDVIGTRDGIFPEGERWYPSEVVELTAHIPAPPGYEGCLAILLLNALKHGDQFGWFDVRWEGQGASICALRPSTRDPILAGIRHLYETDVNFLHLGRVDPTRLSEGATIPVVDDL